MASQCGEYDGIKYEITDNAGTTGTLKLDIPPGKTIAAIPGCMVGSSANVTISGKLKKTLKALVGPDHARSTMFSVAADSPSTGWVMLSPSFFGSITAVPLAKGEEVLVSDDAYLGSIGTGIETTVKSQGLRKAMYSGSGLFVRKVKAPESGGVIFVCAVGAISRFELQTGQSVVVDNGHLVLWPNHMNYVMHKATKTWIGSGISGEGIVSELTGPGTVLIQTRNPRQIAQWIYRQYPQNSS